MSSRMRVNCSAWIAMSTAKPCTAPCGWCSRMRLFGYAARFPGRAGAQQELRHRRREPHAHGCDVAAQRLHRVVDREAGVDLAAGRVQEERDVAVAVRGVEDEELRADPFGDGAVDRAGEHDAALGDELAPPRSSSKRPPVSVTGDAWVQDLSCNCMVARS